VSEYHKIDGLHETQVAYFAGLLDGEGCVRVGRFKNSSGALRYRAYMVIAMTDVAPINWLAENVGGRKYVDRKVRPNNSKLCFVWQCNAQEGCVLLKRAIQYLLVKQPQAENYIAFAETISGRGGKGEAKPIPAPILMIRKHLAERSLLLNKKGAA